MILIINWLLGTAALLIVAYLLPGISVRSFWTALVAALVIGLVNATVGLVLKILTFPLILASLGLFWFVINALMLMLAGWLVPGFEVAGFWWALLGAVLLSVLHMVFSRATRPRPV
jgi:putative membrane protein